ncbi:cytochrome P450 71A4-like protein [Tanacetum coccineum]
MILEDDLEKMRYLKAAIKEGLRLHPPGPLLVPREASEEVKLMGYHIPKGTQVIINAYAIGRVPTLWEEPDEFKPERFLNSSTDYKCVDYQWLPFGAGRRKCPGIQFSVDVIELALANVAPYKAGGPFLPLVEPEAASLPLVRVGLSTSQPPPYTVEDGIETYNP